MGTSIMFESSRKLRLEVVYIVYLEESVWVSRIGQNSTGCIMINKIGNWFLEKISLQ